MENELSSLTNPQRGMEKFSDDWETVYEDQRGGTNRLSLLKNVCNVVANSLRLYPMQVSMAEILCKFIFLGYTSCQFWIIFKTFKSNAVFGVQLGLGKKKRLSQPEESEETVTKQPTISTAATESSQPSNIAQSSVTAQSHAPCSQHTDIPV